MINNDKHCETWNFAFLNLCNRDNRWVNNVWCEKSCFENGVGYEYSNCCPNSPPSTPVLAPYIVTVPPSLPPESKYIYIVETNITLSGTLETFLENKDEFKEKLCSVLNVSANNVKITVTSASIKLLVRISLPSLESSQSVLDIINDITLEDLSEKTGQTIISISTKPSISVVLSTSSPSLFSPPSSSSPSSFLPPSYSPPPYIVKEVHRDENILIIVLAITIPLSLGICAASYFYNKKGIRISDRTDRITIPKLKTKPKRTSVSSYVSKYVSTRYVSRSDSISTVSGKSGTTTSSSSTTSSFNSVDSSSQKRYDGKDINRGKSMIVPPPKSVPKFTPPSSSKFKLFSRY